MAFTSRFSHQQCGLSETHTHSFTLCATEAFCARLVLHIWGCFSKSARFVCAPLSLKKYLPGCGRWGFPQKKTSPHYGWVESRGKCQKVLKDRSGDHESNFSELPRHSLPGTHSYKGKPVPKGRPPGSKTHTCGLLGKPRLSHICLRNVLIKALFGPHLSNQPRLPLGRREGR